MRDRFKGDLEAWAVAKHTGACLQCDRAIALVIDDTGTTSLIVDSDAQCQDGRLLMDACTIDQPKSKVN